MSKQLEIVLKHSGLLAPDALARCADLARRRNLTLIETVLKEGQLTEDNLAEAFAKYLRLPRVKLATSVSEPEALKKVPEKIVRKHFDLTPRGIDETHDLRRPIYRVTAYHGHFGRENVGLPWERTDRAEAIRRDL